MGEDHHQRVEQVASAVEDLIQMGILNLKAGTEGEAFLSPHFSRVVANVLADMKAGPNPQNEQIMKMMYYSILIYMTERLKIPRSFAMALGNDMEKNRESMETGELVATYVSILSQIWSRGIKETSR